MLTGLPSFVITADALVSMDESRRAILDGGGVAVRGDRIVDVGSREELLGKYPGVRREDFAGAMMPGFVNAHTHLELGYQRRGESRPAGFTEWVTGLMQQYPPADAVEAAVAAATRKGIADSLRSGVTTVGDISRHCEVTRRVLAASAIRAVSFGEVIGLGKMRGRCEGYLEAAADGTFVSERLRVGLSPHAPYTVEGPVLRRTVDRAVADRLPITMHLAELLEERDFLRDRSGALGEWSVMKNLVDEGIPSCRDGPLHWAKAWGLLGSEGAGREVPVLLAHVNYCDEGELALLAGSNVSVVYCPRTREYFGHVPRHGYREMLAAGVNVCLGTDALASNPVLSVLREAGVVCARDGVSAYTALEMITWRGAKALGVEAGQLAVGMLADVVVMEGEGGGSVDEIVEDVVRNARGPGAVFVGGERVLV